MSSTFYEVITAAIADMAQHGYDSQERVELWAARIRAAARAALIPEPKLNNMLERTFKGVYANMVERGRMLKQHQGIARFTLDWVKPRLRAELDRRIMASANLIKLNRVAAIEKTLQRFQGWSTSIPAGGSRAVDKPEVKADLRKAMAQLPFEERRVLIDQGHKFNAALNNILAVDGGALAMMWHSHWRQPGYNYRKDHKERDQHIYLLRESWAKEKGYIKPGPDGYYDQITQVGEEPFCRCNATYLYALRDLPANMVTQKGADELARVRAAIRA